MATDIKNSKFGSFLFILIRMFYFAVIRYVVTW